MSNRRTLNTLILAAALMIGAGPYVVKAARTVAEPPAMANIDLQAVYNESETRKATDTKTGLYARKLDQKFSELGNLPYLTTVEIRDLSDLVIKENLTPEEAKQMADVRAEAEKRANEVQQLAAKKDADLTAADRNRMRELNNMRQTQPQNMLKVQGLYQLLVNEEDQKNTRAGMAELRAQIAKLAKEKGISEVFDTTALIVAPADLTKDAIQRLKKKAP